MMTNLFAEDSTEYVPILLIDASGSVSCPFSDVVIKTQYDLILHKDKPTIFSKILDVITNYIPEEKFRLLFWNSNQEGMNVGKGGFFKGGVWMIDYIVDKTKIQTIFKMVGNNISMDCLTFTHLSFNNIPPNWISTVNKVYLITDGQIGYGSASPSELRVLHNAFSESVIKFVGSALNANINILTIEPKNRDFSNESELSKAAGCDVYKIIMEKNLTKYISKFISFTPSVPDGFTHINRNIQRKGYVPFGEKSFLEKNTPEFIQYLKELIESATSEDDLLNIIQNLVSTLGVLTNGKPIKLSVSIIDTFCGLFKNTSIDPMFISFILGDNIKKELEGRAVVFASYKTQLRNLYKEADNLLSSNASNSIGINERYITLPIQDTIISGHCSMIDCDVNDSRKTYKNGAVSINGHRIPVFPFNFNHLTPMNEQCLRQWIRFVLGSKYRENTSSDMLIYYMFGIVLHVCHSDNIPEDVKNIYRYLGTVMLKKKCPNVEKTELERLREGGVPFLSNRTAAEFEQYISRINSMYDFNQSPYTTWYLMCVCLKDDELIKTQYIHCKDGISSDLSVNPDVLTIQSNKFSALKYHSIPLRRNVDYRCLISLENLEDVGGYGFPEHTNFNEQRCAPIYMVSEESHLQLIQNDTYKCPVCYVRLNPDDMIKIGRLEEINLNILSPAEYIPDTHVSTNRTTTASQLNVVNTSTSNQDTSDTPDPFKIVVEMKGVVGSGKTTIATRISEIMTERGYVCAIESVDKYLIKRMKMGQAISEVKSNIYKFKMQSRQKRVIIIDTCGDIDMNPNRMVFFDVSFAGWTKVVVWANFLGREHMDEYLSWSLRNVLMRNRRDTQSTYSLNPFNEQPKKCYEIHQRKSEGLFGAGCRLNLRSEKRKNMIEELNEKAQKYIELLSQESNGIDVQIERSGILCLS